MEEYLKINRKAYEVLASEFDKKTELRSDSFNQIVREFEPYLETFIDPRILELGPGSGGVSKLLSDHGYNVTAIEFSEAMSEVVRKIAPNVNLITDEFLRHDFGEDKYSGILAIAFIHLFPKRGLENVLQKMHSLLVPSGVAFVSTTLHDQSEEGYASKTNFSKDAVRYRRKFTSSELEELFVNNHFKIIYDNKIVDDKEVKGKVWGSYVLQKA